MRTTIGKIEGNKVIKEYSGENCIYKNFEAFYNKTDEVCYVPEHTDSDNISEGYKYADFLEMSNYDDKLAVRIFENCEYQHPSTVLNEMIMDDDDEEIEIGRTFKIDLSEYKFKDISINSPELKEISKTITELVAKKAYRPDNYCADVYEDDRSNSEKIILETGYKLVDELEAYFFIEQTEKGSPVFIVNRPNNY